jgi:hypothetical protein
MLLKGNSRLKVFYLLRLKIDYANIAKMILIWNSGRTGVINEKHS